MKILVIYGGINNGLKKEIIQAGLHRKQDGSKLTNIKYLHQDIQFYLKTIKQLLNKQSIIAKDDIELVSRHCSDLDDYLYEYENTIIKEDRQPFDHHHHERYDDTNSAKRFDYIDFVIIDGPGTLLPWQEKSRQLTLIVKQCKYTKKPLFIAGCGIG